MATIILINKEIKVIESLDYVYNRIRHNSLFIKLTQNNKTILVNKNQIVIVID